MIYKENDKIYEQYEVANTDFIVEVCEEPFEKEYIEVWLYRQGFGIKMLMFAMKREEDYVDIINANVDEYIEDYEKEYCNE